MMFFRQQKYRNKIERFHTWATWHLNADADIVEYLLYLSSTAPTDNNYKGIWKTIMLLLKLEGISYDY
tara:strand:- start:21198 stop:21401 length:204 start_codon:yes stop_codon:yes gene_type:complete